MAKHETSALVDQVRPIVQDAERLATLHTDLLRSELRQTASAVLPALSSIGAGAGLAAAGGFLASLALVHGLHRSSRLPLWGCYGVVGSNALDFGVARWLLSALAAAVAGLVAVALVLLRPRVHDLDAEPTAHVRRDHLHLGR